LRHGTVPALEEQRNRKSRTWGRPAGTSQWTPADPEAAGLLSLPGGLRSSDPGPPATWCEAPAGWWCSAASRYRPSRRSATTTFSDPFAASQAAGPASAPRLAALAAEVDHTIRIDVYVDVDRIRRLEVPEDLRSVTPVTRPDTNRVSATIDFVRFGIDPGDLAPPS